MSDGRWLALGALAGLAAVKAAHGSAAVKKSDPAALAAKLKGKLGGGGDVPFPVPGIAARSLGPLSIVVYEREDDLKVAANDMFRNNLGRQEARQRNSTIAVLKPGEGVPRTLPKDANAAYGPEIQTHVWAPADFPGWLILDIDAVGGIGGGPPTPSEAPKRKPDQQLTYPLIHVPTGEIKIWGMDAADLLAYIILTEAAAPGFGTKSGSGLMPCATMTSAIGIPAAGAGASAGCYPVPRRCPWPTTTRHSHRRRGPASRPAC